MTDNFLEEAIEKSKESVRQGGFPVGAVIVKGGEIIATGLSNGKQLHDPTSHAEVDAIRSACKKLSARDLKDVTLYSSLEPCIMCLSASFWASIPKVVYACGRNKVSKQHYEGDYDLEVTNKKFRKPIEILHVKDMENDALAVIEDWEASLG